MKYKCELGRTARFDATRTDTWRGAVSKLGKLATSLNHCKASFKRQTCNLQLQVQPENVVAGLDLHPWACIEAGWVRHRLPSRHRTRRIMGC